MPGSSNLRRTTTAEELVEPVDESRRRSDEVPGTGRDQPLGIEDRGERIADPLQDLGSFALADDRGGARLRMLEMTVWGVGIVRDEADIIEATVTRMLREVDHVLVADNLSVDGTADILHSLDRVTVLADPDPDFHVDHQQARRTTALASLAGQRGADWVVPFDADEVWVAHDGRRLGDVLDGLPASILVARARMLDHVITDRDPLGPDALARMVYRRPEFHRTPKVACRPRPGLWIVKGNHRATYPRVPVPRWVDGLLRVHHFPFRSPEQFARKFRYRADGVWRSKPTVPQFLTPDKEDWLRILESEGEDALMARFDEEHRFADPDKAGLVLDPCP